MLRSSHKPPVLWRPRPTLRNVDGHGQRPPMWCHCGIRMKLLIIIICVDVSTARSTVSHAMTSKAKFICGKEMPTMHVSRFYGRIEANGTDRWRIFRTGIVCRAERASVCVQPKVAHSKWWIINKPSAETIHSLKGSHWRHYERARTCHSEILTPSPSSEIGNLHKNYIQSNSSSGASVYFHSLDRLPKRRLHAAWIYRIYCSRKINRTPDEQKSMLRTNSVCAYAIGWMGKSETTFLLGSLANMNVTTIWMGQKLTTVHISVKWDGGDDKDAVRQTTAKVLYKLNVHRNAFYFTMLVVRFCS